MTATCTLSLRSCALRGLVLLEYHNETEIMSDDDEQCKSFILNNNNTFLMLSNLENVCMGTPCMAPSSIFAELRAIACQFK